MSVIRLKEWFSSSAAPLSRQDTETVPMGEEVTEDEVKRAFGAIDDLDDYARMGNINPIGPYKAAMGFVQSAFEIKGTALRFNGMTMVSIGGPSRHGHIAQSLFDLGMPAPIMGEEGFVDGMGKFLTRRQAARRVVEIGQTLRDPNIDPEYGLRSENLW